MNVYAQANLACLNLYAKQYKCHLYKGETSPTAHNLTNHCNTISVYKHSTLHSSVRHELQLARITVMP